MAKVNWEVEPGETVEEFVAALLLLKHPRGNRVTPSRGDRGVDIRVWNPDGYDIYQVKRYPKRLTAKQAKDIEESWNRFVAETLKVLPVRSWRLVMPWDPTNERLDWLDRLTAGSGISVEWVGRAQLDGLSAELPAVVEYYFGDGGDRILRLMADAIQGRKEVPPGLSGGDLLEAALGRYQSLCASLNAVDPFYRYEMELRTGRLEDDEWELDLQRRDPGAFIRYTQLDDQNLVVLRLVPLSAESHRLRPITGSVRLNAEIGTPHQVALDEFVHFGLPFRDMPGTVTEAEGPPGTMETGAGLVSFMASPGSEPRLHDLEARLLGPAGEILHTLELTSVQSYRGLNGKGGSVTGEDRAGVLRFQFLFGGGERPDDLRVSRGDLVGKSPASVLPAVRMTADFREGNTLVLAICGGKPVSPGWPLHDDDGSVSNARRHVEVLEALSDIQGHTFDRIRVPNLTQEDPRDLAQVIRAANLLRGEELEEVWTPCELTVTNPESLPADGVEEFGLRLTQPLVITLGGEQISLDMEVCTYLQAARLAEPSLRVSISAGDEVLIAPGSTPDAITIAVPRAD
jgi:hypothetical protein